MLPELNSPLLALPVAVPCFLHSEALESWELASLTINHTVKLAENLETGYLDSTKQAGKPSPFSVSKKIIMIYGGGAQAEVRGQLARMGASFYHGLRDQACIVRLGSKHLYMPWGSFPSSKLPPSGRDQEF